MLKTEGLHYQYEGGESELAFPDLSIQKGDELLLLGASGTGKTTLLHLVAGMRTPTRGQVALAGEAFSTLPTAARDRARGRHMGIVFQTTPFRAQPLGQRKPGPRPGLGGLPSGRGPHPGAP